ncbi:MAG: hypothetical protein ACXV3C_03820 [Actinomycetes bacterium]
MIPQDRGAYRTSARYQMDDRRLLLRGGGLDGQTWVGVVAVGKRVFCGEGAWETSGVYLVTAEVVTDAEGQPCNVAVPAFASS